MKQKAALLGSLVFSVLLAADYAQAQSTTNTTLDYVCGQQDAEVTYATREPALLCLFFDDMVKPQKVIF